MLKEMRFYTMHFSTPVINSKCSNRKKNSVLVHILGPMYTISDWRIEV